MHEICCPECRTRLDVENASGPRYCPGCHYHYVIAEGIVDFAADERFYWGEVSREDMLRVNERAEKIGWFQAFLEDIAGLTNRDLARYILDPVRIAGLFHFYNPRRNETCLDLGSGWGSISFGFSQFYRTVYSLDGVYERLRFQAIRARQDRVTNVKLLKAR